ncbi:TPA: phosphotransferase [Streptococcus pyogenes]|nr:phosphotransferase [Streptococcus pyogenes]
MPQLSFISKEPINKGWSCDKKYCVTADDGVKYLLRVTPEEKSANRAEMFRMQQQVAALGVSMCKPVEFGKCDEGVYTVQTWVDGKDAEEIIPYLTDSEQYAFGLEAGRILKVIHSIPAPENQPDWEPRFNAKMDRKIKMYNECPIKFDGAEDIIAYIESNRHLLANRPQTFQHGDYHIGNMMIEKNKIVIIDFDRYDFGDPWEEFNRIVWCAQASPIFASGIINGYFDNEVPLEFWKLLALYISSNMLSSIPWAIPFGESEVHTMLNQAKDVLSWYKNMQKPVPTWYVKQRTDSKISFIC